MDVCCIKIGSTAVDTYPTLCLLPTGREADFSDHSVRVRLVTVKPSRGISCLGFTSFQKRPPSAMDIVITLSAKIASSISFMECTLVPWDQGQVWVTLDSDAFVCLLLVLLDSLGLVTLPFRNRFVLRYSSYLVPHHCCSPCRGDGAYACTSKLSSNKLQQTSKSQPRRTYGMR